MSFQSHCFCITLLQPFRGSITCFQCGTNSPYQPCQKPILSLGDRVMFHAPEIGGVIAHNQHQKRRKMNRLSVEELVQNKTIFPTMIIPRANDGLASHTVIVVDDIIFDATQCHGINLCRESFEWICGKNGVGGIERALPFKKPDKIEKRYARTMAKNW
jgi:hypothetical protein